MKALNKISNKITGKLLDHVLLPRRELPTSPLVSELVVDNDTPIGSTIYNTGLGSRNRWFTTGTTSGDMCCNLPMVNIAAYAEKDNNKFVRSTARGCTLCGTLHVDKGINIMYAGPNVKRLSDNSNITVIEGGA